MMEELETVEEGFWDHEKYPNSGRPEEQCSDCKGTGELTDIDDGTTFQCRQCKGKGWVSTDYPCPVQEMYSVYVTATIEMEILAPNFDDEFTRALMIAVRKKDHEAAKNLFLESIQIDTEARYSMFSPHFESLKVEEGIE